MDTDQLRAFDAIVRQGSFVRAAATLEVAQATISARIQALEREVGSSLFTRGRRVKLTDRGEQFLEYARRALEVLEEGIETIQSAEQHRLRVGVTESLGGAFLSATLQAYLAVHPNAQVFAQATTCTQVMRMLQDRLIQFGLIPWPYTGAPPELQVMDRYREPVVAVTHPDHPLTRHRRVSLEELRVAAQPWHSSWLDEPANSILAPFGLDHTSALNLPAHTVRHLLLGGVGAALLTRTSVQDDVSSGRLVELQLTGQAPHDREFALVHTGKEQVTSEAREAFRQAVRTAAKHLEIQTVSSYSPVSTS